MESPSRNPRGNLLWCFPVSLRPLLFSHSSHRNHSLSLSRNRRVCPRYLRRLLSHRQRSASFRLFRKQLQRRRLLRSLAGVQLERMAVPRDHVRIIPQRCLVRGCTFCAGGKTSPRFPVSQCSTLVTRFCGSGPVCADIVLRVEFNEWQRPIVSGVPPAARYGHAAVALSADTIFVYG